MQTSLGEAPLVTAYRELHALSGQQLETLASEDLETFQRLGEAREALFARLQSLEPDVSGLPDEVRAIIQTLIPAILRQDQLIEIRLNELSSRTRGELSTLQNGLTALQAYASQSHREAIFIDRNS